jgi:ParB family transcriptional regulator, chromosome partitioning protein
MSAYFFIPPIFENTPRPKGFFDSPSVEAAPKTTHPRLETRQIRLEQITFGPGSKRWTIDGQDLAEVKARIKRGDRVPPMILRQVDPAVEEYDLIVGETRLKAYRELGVTEITAVITPSEKHPAVGLIQYLQSNIPSPIEVAMIIARLKELGNYTDEEIGIFIGHERHTVSSWHKIARMHPDIFAEVKAGKPSLSISMLVDIAQGSDVTVQRKLLAKAKSGASRSEIRASKKELTKP